MFLWWLVKNCYRSTEMIFDLLIISNRYAYILTVIQSFTKFSMKKFNFLEDFNEGKKKKKNLTHTHTHTYDRI